MHTKQGPNRNSPSACQDPFCMITSVESPPVSFTRVAKTGAAARPCLVHFVRRSWLSTFREAQARPLSHAWKNSSIGALGVTRLVGSPGTRRIASLHGGMPKARRSRLGTLFSAGLGLLVRNYGSINRRRSIDQVPALVHRGVVHKPLDEVTHLDASLRTEGRVAIGDRAVVRWLW